MALAVLLGLTLPAGGVLAQREAGSLDLSAEGPGVTCNNDGCVVPPGGDFTLIISVGASPDEGYIGIQTQVRYQNLTYNPTATQTEEIVVDVDGFPGIAVRAPDVPGVVQHGMTAGTPPNFTTSHYTGPIVELAMRCTSNYTRNDVQLPAYHPQNNVLGSGFQLPVSAGAETVVSSDSLTIRCGQTPAGGEPTNTPPPSGNGGTAGPPATPDLSSPEGRATATQIARTTATAVAETTATAVARSGGEDDEDDDGGNTGLWIALGAIGGAAVLLGAGYYGWRRYRQGSEG